MSRRSAVESTAPGRPRRAAGAARPEPRGAPRARSSGCSAPSGCGKSTLMRSIVGVQQVAGGTVTVLGHPAGIPALRRRVGYVTQAPERLRRPDRRPRTCATSRRSSACRGARWTTRSPACSTRSTSPTTPTPGSDASPAASARGSRSPPPCVGRPSCSSSTSRPSGSTRCCAATCGTLFRRLAADGVDPARVQPRHGRGHPLRPAAAAARGPAARRRHARRRCSTAPAPPTRSRRSSRSSTAPPTAARRPTQTRHHAQGGARHEPDADGRDRRPGAAARSGTTPAPSRCCWSCPACCWGCSPGSTQTPPVFDSIGAPLLGIFPFVVMFLVTSIATLRERHVRHAGAAAHHAAGQG